MDKPRIGVFGSAFDPPTLGHQDVLQQAAEHFDQVLLVPSASHAFNKKPRPFAIRLALLEVFAQNAEVETELVTCDIEIQLLQQQPDKPVYTFDLLEALEQKYQGAVELSFIRGPDNAAPVVWRRFYKADEIEQRWSVFTAKERLNIRSSTVRSILNSTMADGKHTLDHYLLPEIAAYIHQHKLYQGTS